MRVSEPNAALRRIYFAVRDTSTGLLSTTAAVSPPLGTIQVSLNGASWTNGSGSFVHAGHGSYYYEATQGELSVQGFFGVKFTRTSFRTEITFDDVGVRFAQGETNTNLLRIPLAITDTAFQLATGATVTTASDLQLSVNGASYADAGGTLVEVGAGLYYYQGVAADASIGGEILVTYAPASGFAPSTSFQSVVATGGGGGVASLVALAPPDGTQLAIDPEIARFTPVVATLKCAPGEAPYVFARVGSLNWTVYDGSRDETMPFFGDHTTVTPLGTNEFTISVLPNGGWWRSSIELRFVSGVELG